MKSNSKKKFIFRSRSGMSLVEISISMLIFLALFAGLIAASDISEKYWSSNKARIELQRGMRIAMIWISSELRQASASSIVDVFPDGISYAWITFQIPTGVTGSTVNWSSAIRYIVAFGADGRKKLFRIQGAESKVIANDIETLSVVRQADNPTTSKNESNIVEVSITGQKDTIYGRHTTANLNFSVQLRN